MGEENSTPRSDPETPKKRVDARGAHIDAARASAGGETTLDTGGSGATTTKAEDRMSIGPYVLVKKLGEGGMGQVWLAEQTAPVKRQVALKLIKGGLYDNAVIQRFEEERQSLAVMNHPAIAKVFDAGATKDGQPYFVMEYVDGLPITKYCDAKKLTIRERLTLFIKVCEGVQHAHQKAIIHRDLKPSNMLVVEVDGKPVPRIIDFGLAKAISPQPGAEQTLFTQMGRVVGTRGFMSPEQADPSVLDVDTRADVYSLGVTLYALLTGTLPFDPEQWKKKPFDEVLRQLREEDPPSPSTKLNEEKETAKDSATNRGTAPKKLVALLRGDLDWITLKAVEKDRARRYGTPSELAGDLDRYLQNRPVVARPASTRYRVRKYVQRHRVGVTTASGAVALLVAFAIAQAVQLRRITRERDRANRITDFMTSMFKVSDPSEARGSTITAREILDKSSKDIEGGLSGDPILQAQLMSVMGSVYQNLGLYPRAYPLIERSAQIRRRLLGPESPETLQSNDELAWILYLEDHLSQAESLQRENLAIRRRILGPNDPDTATSITHLAGTLEAEGHYVEAEKLYREGLEIRRRVLGPEAPSTLTSIGNLAVTFEKEGRNSEAEKSYREVLDARRRVLGPEHPNTLWVMGDLAGVLQVEGRNAEAERLIQEVLDTQRRVLGPEHPNTLTSENVLAMILQSEKRYAEAEKMQRETLAIDRRVYGPEHAATVSQMGNLAITFQYEGRNADAEKLYREVLDISRRTLGPEHLSTLTSMSNLAGVLGEEGHYAEGERLMREALGIERRVLGADHPLTTMTMYDLAGLTAHRGQSAEALTLLREAMDHGLAVQARQDMITNPSFKSLHGNPQFQALLANAKERAAAAQKPN
jgi:serine/threonine protein kinase